MSKQVDIKNCTFKIKDGAAHELEFKIADGGLSFRLRRNLVFRKNRGKLDLVLLGDEIPVEASFDVTIENIKSKSADAQVTPYEFLTKRYAAAGYMTVGDACESYAFDIEILNDEPCTGVDDETITLPEFRVDRIDGGIKDATLKVTGRCNATVATAIRS